MIIKRTIHNDNTGTLIECIIDSSNILKTAYFAHNQNFYIYFNRGHCYAYQKVPSDVYREFEEADSQGEYFRKVIAKEYSYQKLFSLTETELNEAKNIIKEWKENNQV
jgi:hypothetical protein